MKRLLLSIVVLLGGSLLLLIIIVLLFIPGSEEKITTEILLYVRATVRFHQVSASRRGDSAPSQPKKPAAFGQAGFSFWDVLEDAHDQR